jgi:hypothetical protein
MPYGIIMLQVRLILKQNNFGKENLIQENQGRL